MYGVNVVAKRAASVVRKASLRTQFPGLEFKGSVHISPQCDIFVGRGGSLTICDCRISKGVTITVAAGAKMVIEADFIGPHSVIVAREQVVIGAGSKVAENVVIRDGNHDHSVPLREMVFTAASVHVGEDVWLGAGCAILQGVTVGAGSTVGAGAVVTKNVPPNTIAVGVPAKSRPC